MLLAFPVWRESLSGSKPGHERPHLTTNAVRRRITAARVHNQNIKEACHYDDGHCAGRALQTHHQAAEDGADGNRQLEYGDEKRTGAFRFLACCLHHHALRQHRRCAEPEAPCSDHRAGDEA